MPSDVEAPLRDAQGFLLSDPATQLLERWKHIHALTDEINALRDAHDARVSELLAANAREVESRRRANRERDMAQTMLRAIAGALMKAETERDNANRIMREVLAENVQLLADLGGRDTLSLEDGTEGGNG